MAGEKEQTEKKSDGKIFTDEGLRNIVGFFDTLKKIHTRLMNEGWKYENGKLIPPEKQKPFSNGSKTSP